MTLLALEADALFAFTVWSGVHFRRQLTGNDLLSRKKKLISTEAAISKYVFL